MKRKIVKQGAATLMVSLPSKWCRKNKINKGDEVNIEEKQNNLIVGLEPGKHKTSIEFNISNLTESSIRTLLTNTYRLGYDKVKVNFKDKNAFEIIKETINKNLLGFEIIKKRDNSCEIENVTEPAKEQFDNIFSKIFLNIEELFRLTNLEFQGKKQEFHEIERKIQQFDNFCKRVISKFDIFSDSHLRWSFHVELIHAQRELYHMLKYLSKNRNRIKVEKQVHELLEKCEKVFEMLKKAYYEKDILLLEKIHEIEKRFVYKNGYELIIKNKNKILTHHLIGSIRNFYLASSPLMGMFLLTRES